MSVLPERPDLRQLKIQAKDLTRAFAAGDPIARERVAPYFASSLSLQQAQLVIAREYGFDSWRLLKAHVDSLTVTGALDQAIRAGDLNKVQELFRSYPMVIEQQMAYTDGGTPFTLAAQMGQLAIVQWLIDRGSHDLQRALSRAAMRGHRDLMTFLVSRGADPQGPYARGAEDYGTPMTAVCEAINGRGMRILLELGGSLTWRTGQGREQNAAAMLLATYSRKPSEKAECLALCEEYGIELPKTPVMALHRRRFHEIEHSSLGREWSYDEIWPSSLGIAYEEGLSGVPLEGATLLHIAIEFDDVEAADWLLAEGADPNALAEDGHPALFHAVLNMGVRDEGKARLLVERGANPNQRGSFRKRWPYAGDSYWEQEHRYDGLTALELARAEDWPEWLRNEAAERYLASLNES